MIGYASSTGTKRNLAALRAAGWGLVVSPTGRRRTEGFKRYGLDNGAWTAHRSGKPWDAESFYRLVETLGSGAEWIVAPDVVGGGLESLALSLGWLPHLHTFGKRRLIAVQDGMRPDDVRPYLTSGVGVFLGGTTEWKLETMPIWGALAREVGCYFHVGRVNSVRRIAYAASCGADSFDGTSVSRFAVTLPKLDKARRQRAMVIP